MSVALAALLALVLGTALGAAFAFFLAKAKTEASIATATSSARSSEATAKAEAEAAKRNIAELTVSLQEARAAQVTTRMTLESSRLELAQHQAQAATFEARVAELQRSHLQAKETFEALSAAALRQNNETFLQLARTELEKATTTASADLEKRQVAIDEMVAPIRESLAKYQEKIAEIEQARAESFGSLGQRLEQVLGASDLLRTETQKLVQALRAPRVRGRWGEIQLERVVELAGMLEYCDFTKQTSVDSEGGRLRPDMTIRLPNGKTIVVDSKTPLEAYIAAVDETDETKRRELLVQHARHVRQHLDQLSKKNYWDQFDGASPEFVVLFIPGEVFFSAALEHDPSLIEVGVEQRVILSTPTTLIALLKAVAFGWRQERLTQSALQIATLGKDLYERLATLGGHFDDVGKSLEKAVGSYNRAVGSLEARVMVTARKFGELGVAVPDDLIDVRLIEAAPRELQAAELRVLPELPALPA